MANSDVTEFHIMRFRTWRPAIFNIGDLLRSRAMFLMVMTVILIIFIQLYSEQKYHPKTNAEQMAAALSFAHAGKEDLGRVAALMSWPVYRGYPDGGSKPEFRLEDPMLYLIVSR